jgi:hypothetical protein
MVARITAEVRDVPRVWEYVTLAGREVAARHDLAIWSPLPIIAARMQAPGCRRRSISLA